MKFITEDDLRLAYKSVPFTSYVIMPQERLTPGGRQFLIDRQIRICASSPPDPGEAGPGRKEDIRLSGADCKISSDTAAFIRTVQALLLQTGSDLLEINVLTAQEIFTLERRVAGLLKERPAQGPECIGCAGITPDNWDCLLEDCFEVTGFHAQSPRGREIVRLHLLRCTLRQLAGKIPGHQRKLVYPVINRLSQMICLAFGGNTCQKKH